jgi:hypothetical protein
MNFTAHTHALSSLKTMWLLQAWYCRKYSQLSSTQDFHTPQSSLRLCIIHWPWIQLWCPPWPSVYHKENVDILIRIPESFHSSWNLQNAKFCTKTAECSCQPLAIVWMQQQPCFPPETNIKKKYTSLGKKQNEKTVHSSHLTLKFTLS